MGFALFHLPVRIVVCFVARSIPPPPGVPHGTFKLGWAGGFEFRDTTVVVVNSIACENNNWCLRKLGGWVGLGFEFGDGTLATLGVFWAGR